MLIIIPVLAFVAGTFMVVFILRYWIGAVTFWGKPYLKQGYHILQSDRLSFYFLDAVAIYSLSVLYFSVRSFHPSWSQLREMGSVKSSVLLVVAVLLSLPFRKKGVFYNDQGLLTVKPFQDSRLVPWSEIGSIQKWLSPQKYHVVLDRDGERLAVFSLNKKTRRFIDLAQRNAVSQSTEKWL